jgi:hypothetical protein
MSQKVCWAAFTRQNLFIEFLHGCYIVSFAFIRDRRAKKEIDVTGQNYVCDVSTHEDRGEFRHVQCNLQSGSRDPDGDRICA